MLGTCLRVQEYYEDVSTAETKNLPQIYTEWANYYLERAKSKKRVTDLSIDCRDGLLLADIITAVTTYKVPDLIKKPKTPQQMYDNVNSCLNLLRSHSVNGLETIAANDISSGRLKTVLALFFALSRYKQATKQKLNLNSPTPPACTNNGVKHQQQVLSIPSQQQQHLIAVNPPQEMTNRQIPVPHVKPNSNGTAIPLPATVLVTRRCPPDKVRPLPPTPSHTTGIPCVTPKNVTDDSNSRPNSPNKISNGTSTFIQKSGNSFRSVQPELKLPTNSYSTQINNTVSNHLPNGGLVTNIQPTTKHSVLDKLKLFNKDKSDRSSKTQASKRTSSSSGFSSARSERSDSNLSLNDLHSQSSSKLLSNGKNAEDMTGVKIKNKLLISSNKNQTKCPIGSGSKSNKNDRKEKSPIQSCELQGNDCRSGMVAKTTKSISKMEAKTKTPIGGCKKIEIRPECKGSVTQQKLSTTAPGTNIPKPMALIKGTSKSQIQAGKIDPQRQLPEKPLTDSSIPKNISEEESINNSIYYTEPTSSNHQHPHQSSITKQKSDISSSSSRNLKLITSIDTDVIYKSVIEVSPEIDLPKNPLAYQSQSKPINTVKQSMPDQSIHLGNNQKFHTIPSKIIHGTILEEEKQMTIVPPMRPLLRGYNSHVTLPTRGTRGQYIVSEYCEDLNQGYCSDGDALKKAPLSTRCIDIDNGYMSEGSGGAGAVHGKHLMSMIRSRSHLPTTFEETCRKSRSENLNSVSSTIPLTMEMNSPGNRSQRGNREHWAKISDQLNNHSQKLQTTPPSPTSNRKERNSPSHSRRSTSTKNNQTRTKNGTAPNFGYVKRPNGICANANEIQQQAQQHQQQNTMLINTNGIRTAHVSAVPRSNKVKVSGGTQTCSADLQVKIPPNTRSFSLTGPSATQLSQSIRERLSTGSHSLPKPGSDIMIPLRIQHRGSSKITDGSLSDTQAYAEVKTDYSSYAMWLKHSNTASSRLSEGESVESLGTPINHKIIQRESPRLNRSNSIRSTKSEKMYPSMLTRAPDVEIEPYYCLPIGTIHSNNTVPWSQPTSPTPPNRCLGGPLSPTSTSYNNNHRLNYQKKNDDVHGSAASLLSGGSSLYGSVEERQACEVRRLKRELCDAREQIMSLSTQLSTNAHVVAAFEQSLTNMTQRLQQLSATADRKDSELTEMRQTIELLRKQSIQAGLTSAHMHSMNEQRNHHRQIEKNASIIETTANNTSESIQRHHSSDSMCSLNSISSGCSTQDKKKKKGWLRNSFTKAFSRNAKISKASRNSSMASNLDTQNTIACDTQTSSIPQLSPIKTPHKTLTIINSAKPVDSLEVDGNLIVEDLKKQLREKDLVLTDIRLEALSSASQLESLKDTVVKMRQEMINLKQNNERLQKMVTSRSLAGSEVSLVGGGPISPSGSISEQRRYSLADGNLRPPLDLPKSLDETEEENIPPAPAPEPLPVLSSPTMSAKLTPSPTEVEVTAAHVSTPADDIADHTDGKKIAIAVYLGQPDSFQKYAEEIQETDPFYITKHTDKQDTNSFDNKPICYVASNRNEFNISYTYISGKTTWQNLDYIVRKTFKDYLARIDPGINLGLNTDSITSYHLGEAKRGPEMGYPELLPCGYIVGNIKTLYICLQGVGSLAFESLIPRSIVHRYISLLTEHRRLILCGPSGTGKSYLARKLAEFLVTRSQRGNPSEAIATFNVDHKSSKELRQYLGHIAEQASLSNGASELPSVIILDNLHHASALSDVFQVLLSAGPAHKLPCIIGTMLQATCNTTNLQLHHNFRWVLTANHMEPVKGFLGRYLRRRLFSLELATQTSQPQLAAVLAWLPTVWQHINRFLETHSSSDVTIGPRLFLSCPLDLNDSQVWFTDVWNYHLEPYLVEAVREGVQLYGRRGEWVDPTTFVRDTYPWPNTNGSAAMPSLRLISAEDVGLEGNITANLNPQDPLLNMLMRLQEAANYSGNQEQESDCASLDSNITPDSSAGVE